MWKQSVGDWQERRHRRRGGGPVPESPQAHLPESVASTEGSRRGFLPRDFRDCAPSTAYPAPDGPAPWPRPAPATPLQEQTLTQAIASCWVAVSGVPLDDILDVRDCLDACVGRTVAHHVPLTAPARGDVYIQFASALQAAQAVRTAAYSFSLDNGTAAEGQRLAAPYRPSGSGVSGRPVASSPRSLELVVGWCRDQGFLEERERLRRQLHSVAPHGAAADASSSSTVASSSLESSARGVSGGRGDMDDDGAHPLLPRHRGRLSSSPSPPSRHSVRLSADAGSGHAAAFQAQDYYQYKGAYRYEDSAFSDGLHSSFSDGRPHTSLLSLFFHPCSSTSYPVVYGALRLLVWVLWSAFNLVALAVAAVSPAAGRAAQSAAPSTAWGGPTPPVLPPPPRLRSRQTQRDPYAVPASASPLTHLAALLYRSVPFAPDVRDVDLALWSWLVVCRPYPHESLRLLRERLLVRQRGVGGGGGGSGGAFEAAPWTATGRIGLDGGEGAGDWVAQQRRRARRSEPAVLLTWRPAWFFARYASVSLVVAVLISCYAAVLALRRGA